MTYPQIFSKNRGAMCVRRMVTFRHRGSPPTSFSPIQGWGLSVRQPGPAAKALSLSRPPHCGTFGTPTGCFPSAIRKTLVRRFRWSARSMHGSRKTADLLTTVFYTSWVGRKRPDRADRMPPRAWEAIRRDRIGGAPSKSKICEV